MLPDTGGATDVGPTTVGGVTVEGADPEPDGALWLPVRDAAPECGALSLALGPAGDCEPLHAASTDSAPAPSSARRRFAHTEESPEHFPRRSSGNPAAACG